MRILVYTIFIQYVFGLFIPIYKRGKAINPEKSSGNKLAAKVNLCKQLEFLQSHLPNGADKDAFKIHINSIKNGESYTRAMDNIRIDLEKISIPDKPALDRIAINKSLDIAGNNIKDIITQRRADFIRHNVGVNEDSPNSYTKYAIK